MNKQNEKLTEKEIIVLVCSLNYDELEAQLNDNFSIFNVNKISKEFSMSPQAIGGVTSSLIQKGLMQEWDGQIYHTEKGVETIFAVIENKTELKKYNTWAFA